MYTIVEIELKRVQSYLFAASTLKSMIGANVLLGETLRGVFDGERFLPGSLPHLAVECGAAYPSQEDPSILDAVQKARSEEAYAGVWAADLGDPALVAKQTGVLVRDASRLHACFPTEELARDFMEVASRWVRRRLPGTLMAMRCSGKEVDLPESAGVPFDLPQAEICEVSANELASFRQDDLLLGSSMAEKYEAAVRFNDGKSHDILGLLRDAVVETQLRNHTGEGEVLWPLDFEAVAPSGYMAVVHADGNAIGERVQRKLSTFDRDQPSQLQEWASLEPMFQTLRSSLRQAVIAAIGDAFKPYCRRAAMRQASDPPFTMPFRLLMLGGDDLLLACDAPDAFDFAVALTKHVKQLTQEMDEPLSLGVGIAITKSKFPFHRAHTLAEQLTSSAKHGKARAADANSIDWLVSSQSWHGQIADTRRREAIRRVGGQTLVLTNKPYPVLDAGYGLSLQQLLENAKELHRLVVSNQLARSQLKQLLTALPQGSNYSRFVCQALPVEVREFLQSTGYLHKNSMSNLHDDAWTPMSGFLVTPMLDLLELLEVQLLRPSTSSCIRDASALVGVGDE